MYIRVRNIAANTSTADTYINGLSKLTTIKDLIEKVKNEFDIGPEQHMLLYYKGKQLNEDEALLHHNVKYNDVITFVLKSYESIQREIDKSVESIESPNSSVSEAPEEEVFEELDVESQYYRINDIVDVNVEDDGAWYEGIIIKIFKKVKENQTPESDAEVIYRVKSDEHVHVIPFETDAKFEDIRPRSWFLYKPSELSVGMKVLANYNIEEPKSRGLWFDFKITEVSRTTLKGTVLIGKGGTPVENCFIKFTKEILRIEQPVQNDQKLDSSDMTKFPRQYPVHCDTCKDVKKKKCKECGCKRCGGKDNIDKIILCDECDYGYHLYCLKPALQSVPEDNWYCPSCKTDTTEIVRAGERLKNSKKKVIVIEKNKRDWGKGFACAGRTKECTIVSRYHLGPIPGVEVGMCWKYRVQASEAGIHRPPIAGIHGRETHAAYSLALSGGYEDDIDYGHEFHYTGSGGRDLSGNKRCSVQCRDQKLTRENKALALSCNAPLNDKVGAEAKNWKGGKPIRVLRSDKLHSKFAPREGVRYDGIYKVVKYYPEKGKSGFLVWKYLLRRDDPTPAPWEEDGEEFDIIYPEGYVEAQEQENKGGKKRKKKQVQKKTSPAKKQKLPYKLPPQIANAIKRDKINQTKWVQCIQTIESGKHKFYEKVENLFKCQCCLDVIHLPVTLNCDHDLCQRCLKQLSDSGIYACPCCRKDFSKMDNVKPNKELSTILDLLFPGYGNCR